MRNRRAAANAQKQVASAARAKAATAARSQTVSAQTAAPAGRAKRTRMSDAEAAAWEEAAKELTAPKVLERLASHQQFVIGNVSLLGTLLTGLGGVAATIAITRETTYVGDVPLIPVGVLVTTVLAGAAVLVALYSRRVRITHLNPADALDVRDYFTNQVVVRGRWLKIATTLFFLAALAAVATAVTVGIVAIADPEEKPEEDPRNRVALASTVGDNGVVTVYLTGAVDNLDDDEYLLVEVTSADRSIISVKAYPDDDGTAELASEARASVGSDSAEATITVLRSATGDGEDEVVGEPFELEASFPVVPGAAPAPA